MDWLVPNTPPYQVSIQAIQAVPGVGVIVRLGLLVADIVHYLVFSLTGNLHTNHWSCTPGTCMQITEATHQEPACKSLKLYTRNLHTNHWSYTPSPTQQNSAYIIYMYMHITTQIPLLVNTQPGSNLIGKMNRSCQLVLVLLWVWCSYTYWTSKVTQTEFPWNDVIQYYLWSVYAVYTNIMSTNKYLGFQINF